MIVDLEKAAEVNDAKRVAVQILLLKKEKKDGFNRQPARVRYYREKSKRGMRDFPEPESRICSRLRWLRQAIQQPQSPPRSLQMHGCHTWRRTICFVVFDHVWRNIPTILPNLDSQWSAGFARRDISKKKGEWKDPEIEDVNANIGQGYSQIRSESANECLGAHTAHKLRCLKNCWIYLLQPILRGEHQYERELPIDSITA